MNDELYTNLITTLPSLFAMIGLVFAVVVDRYVTRQQRILMIIIIILVVSLILQNYMEYRQVVSDNPNIQLRVAESVFGYAVRPVIIVMFLEIISVGRDLLMPWILAGTNVAIYVTAFFSDVCFTITPNNHFQRGPFGYTCHIISAILIGWLIVYSIKDHPGSRTARMIPIFNVGLLFGSVLLDMSVSQTYSLTFLTAAIVLATVFYYVWMHLMFAREHEDALMAEQRIKIMISQIQPHFLYNTLATIQALCMIDPQQASEITEKFGTYLRQNIDSLSQETMIPIEKELEHTKIYTDIEKLRFPTIDINFDIQDSDFMIPSLSIQPLVENAIKHGVRIRKHGEVNIETRSDDDFHIIKVTDNGKGFDVEQVLQMDQSHIGLRNVKERIEKMCNGNFIIESVPDEGTSITIYIPRKGQPE